MLSQTVEYALRAVVCLAGLNGAALTAREIAERMRVPPGYLSKVLGALARARILGSRRGPRGGFVLDRPADVLTVLDVVNAVDPIRRITACPLGLEAHAHALCPLHRRLDEAAAIVEGTLRGSRISELVGDIPEATAPVLGRRGPAARRVSLPMAAPGAARRPGRRRRPGAGRT